MSHPLLAKMHDVLLKIKNALMATPYTEDVKGIIRTIEQVYVKTANGTFESSASEGTNDDENVSYSLRQKPEPEKKGTGYKVFVLGKDGKLYPPMVANPNGAATPVGVWLDADAAPVAGESKTGRPQVKQGGKGTQGGSGKLAYRPGWHLGVIPYAIQFNRKDAEGNKTLFPKNFVFAEVEYAADKDYQDEAHAEGINGNGKYQHSLAGLKHLPTDGYYMYRTNPNPETDPWVITGAMKVNRLLTRAEQADIVRKAGREPQKIQEGDIVTDDVVNSINQEIAAAPKFSLKVYHGSGADFTEFDFDHMGEGAGSQSFGWGGYVTSSKKIGKSYADLNRVRNLPEDIFDTENKKAAASYVQKLITQGYDKESAIQEVRSKYDGFLDNLNHDDTSRKNNGVAILNLKERIATLDEIEEGKLPLPTVSLYEVDIPDDNGSNYLEWEKKPSNEVATKIIEGIYGLDDKTLDDMAARDIVFRTLMYDYIKNADKEQMIPILVKTNGLTRNTVYDNGNVEDDMRFVYNRLSNWMGSQKAASKFLSSLGFTGIKYPAGTIYGGAEEGDVNYVIFKPEDMQIVEHEKFSVKSNVDNQGNPLNQDGTLKLEKIKSVDELTDEDFLHPTRNVELPSLPKKIADAIGTEGKPVVIKKNIFERNYMRHKDVTPELSKKIFKSALYNPDLYGQNQKKTRPYNWVLINTKDEKGNNRTVLLEVNPNKDNVEIVHWHFIDERGLKKIRKQVDREDGQLLILPSDKEEVGALSDPTVNLSAANIANPSETSKGNAGKFSLRLQDAINETDTEPTEAQKKSGNYKKVHVKFGGYDYTIENPKGSYRSGVDENGKEWKQKMNDTYGYIRGKFGKDGDHLDMFINDKADLDSWNGDVFVVDQVNQDGTFDEHKVMYGYGSLDEAKKAYLSNYEKGWTGLGNITPVSKADFDKWLDKSNRKLKPFADYADITSKTNMDTAPSSFEEFLEHPAVRYSIRNEKERAAAEDAYNFAQENRPDRYSRYAIVNMEKPGAVPQYLEKKAVADNWRRYYNKLKWGNYKLFDLDKPFEDNVKNLVGKFPETFRKDNDERSSLKSEINGEGPKFSLKDVNDKFNVTYAENGNEAAEGERETTSVRLQKSDIVDVESMAEEYGLDGMWLARYAEGMREKNSAAAVMALRDLKALYLREHIAEKKMLMERDGLSGLLANRRLFGPIEQAIKAKFGDVDVLVEERRKQVEIERGMMEAARKRAEEEQRKREARLEELAGLTDEEIDNSYAEALAKGDEATAREMLDEAARRKGYGDAESEYQGVGAWGAPSKPGYETDEARRNAVGEDSPDLNVEDMAAGYNNQPEDIFVHPDKYSQGLPTSKESGKAIQAAIDDIRNGKKDVKVKVYRAVPASVKEGKLRNGDWVTPSKMYAELHGDNRLEGKYRIIEAEVPVSELWWDSNDVNEWGYDNGKSYRYKNVKNNRKLNDLVTRDDKGNVIPPSKRFNQRKADERYQRGVDGVKPSKPEVALRDAVIDRLRENGMDVIADEAGQRVLDMANGRGAVRTHAMISSLTKAANTIRGWIIGNKRGKSFTIELPETTRRMIRKVMGRDFDSHNITANNIAHAYANHGVGGSKITDSSIPLTKEDMELMPYIMTAPDYIRKGSEDITGRESIRFYKTLSNGYVVVVEKEQKNSPHDMESITMWAEKSPSNVADARINSSPTIDARNVIISTEDAAKIRKDAEEAIVNDVKVREQRVYHGSGADFKAFDHVRFFRTANGDAYGFTVGGKIYIDPRIATSETPVHEYAHLWATALRNGNAEEWQNVVGLMKDTKVWDDVKERYPELKSDDDIADEVIATYSGSRGAEHLRAEQSKIAEGNGSIFEKAEAISALEKVKQALKKFWKGVADLLHIHYKSAEEVADRVMKDLLDGVDPRKIGEAKDGGAQFSETINSGDNIRFSLKEEKEKIVSDAKANGTYMTAPNGEKTKLDAEQWVTVRTTNFKNWFGDWENDPENASKVVDENGEPMVVWHGRSAEFNTFEKKEGVRFIMGLEDKVKAEGFFFSPNKGLAEEFASNSSRHRGGKANVIPCFLNIRKPMDLTREDYDRIYEDVTGWDYIVGMDTQDNLWGIMDEEGMADKIKEKGYDGAIFVEEVDDSYEPTKISYCALDANQIKSAENNNGDFSADNNDIRFSLKSMMEKPEGWKQANKKAIHIAEAIERDPKFSLKNLDGTLIKAGTYFSGGGLVEEGLKGIIDPVVAVEYDEKISGVYRNNFGDHIVTADVRDVDPKELVGKIDGEVEYFHASPVCKNYSLAKNNHEELELDKETAASTAEFISKVRPKVVTIENVKGYKDSEAMKTITDALDEAGYKWDADVYNAADYGGYTNRERLIVRAVRDGELPAKPEKQKRKSGWYEAVEDIIPTLTEKKNGVAPWMDERLKADGIDWRHIDKPLYVMGSGYANGTVPHAFADELLPTLRTKSGDVIVMPDGKVYRAMGRVLARVSGVSDDYQMPASEALSHTIIGNGIPTQLTENVIAPLVRDVLHPEVEEKASLKDADRKQTQLDIILKTNPMLDDYHTGIRKVEDIKTLGESVEEARSEAEKYGYDEWSAYPDITNDMLQNALETGEITIYSSKPIKNGVFVTPSYMQASDYAGGGNVYEKTVPLTDVAWINTDEGQYAKVDGERYSLKEVNDKFNDRLAQLIENPNQKDRVLHLGRSSQFLIDGGIADAEIELDFDKLMRKSKFGYVHEHPFDAADVKDLPLAIANPISVFVNTNGQNDGQVILTELKKDDRNFIVVIRTESQNRKGGVILKVNKIATLFPKDARGVINWYNLGKATNIDKAKALHFIEALQNHSGTLTSEELSSAAKIVRNFVNPKQNDGNLQKTEKYSLRVDRYRDELNQWKKDNNLPKDAERPQLPVREPNDRLGFT